jgi:hypothetical protein
MPAIGVFHCLHELSVIRIVRCTQHPYLPDRRSRGSLYRPSSGDVARTRHAISLANREMETFTMKNFFLAAIAALSFAAAIVPAANAARSPYHSGPYDNTGNGPSQTGLNGGGG